MGQVGAAQPVIACSQCARAFAQSEVVQIAGVWVCADCKPAFLSRIMASGATSPLAWRYGGFWIRFGARFIDGLVLTVPVMILAAVFLPTLLRPASQPSNPLAFAAFGLTFVVGVLVANGFYEVLMLRYRSATLGKIACGLKVVRADGSSLGWGVSVARYLMWNVVTSGIPYLNFILMLITSIMLGVDNEKRALHDRVCGTRVIHKQSIA